ncbi:MAG TPA: hypothetical protein PKY53_04275 [Clostridia bacterium]|jgi:hypothetical protein|nr:hypothetical protein [Clostridia bacterium]
MAEIKKMSQGDKNALRIFFFSAIPLLKVIAETDPVFKKKFVGKSFVFQISVLSDEFKKTGKLATHFVVENGAWTTHVCESHPKPDIELEFPDPYKFILFFTGKGMPLPKMKGVLKNFGKFVALLLTLLRMASLLQAKDAPEKPEDQQLLVKLYFYLLANGISQLNKIGHPGAQAFTAGSPDRTYAYAVEGYEDLQAWLRVKQGNTMSGRGEYKRSKPFLTMRFDTPAHALDILMSKADMIEYMKKGYLTVEGAPEFGATLGNLMMDVGFYAQGAYLDQQAS